MKVTDKARAIAESTKDAYSADAYLNWAACAQVCLDRGYDERETEAILRSKWTRWARDASDNPDGRNTSSDLARYLDKHATKEEVIRLTEQTFANR